MSRWNAFVLVHQVGKYLISFIKKAEASCCIKSLIEKNDLKITKDIVLNFDEVHSEKEINQPFIIKQVYCSLILKIKTWFEL